MAKIHIMVDVVSMDGLGGAAAVEAEMAMELAADAAFQPQEARLLGNGKGPPRPACTHVNISTCLSLFLK
jgi:hypothetical protein